jgi:hypothetical protein
MLLYQFEIAWFSIDRDAAHNVPFDLSTSPFGNCEFLVFAVNVFLKSFGAECAVVGVI